tara:strand:- start:20 stop:1177 length:1158 start_codon:yes stop_codon:yes gene_type:complete
MNKKIYDPIHKYMDFEPLLVKIIDTFEFQRLRNIKQLGICYYVFSGASHNRFEHSLGVSFLAGELIKKIKFKQPELKILDRQILLIKIAGLIHDIGHGCFSHFFDNHFIKAYNLENCENITHEGRSCLIFKEMIKKYELDITPEEYNFIKELINPQNNNNYLYQIISNNKNGIDCDKFDYLLRDTYNIGLPYSFEYYRFIDNVKVINNNLCFSYKLYDDIYDLFNLRLRLHKQIYNHHTVNNIELMLLDIFKLVNDDLNILGKTYNMNEFIKLNDSIIDEIYLCNINTDNVNRARKLIDRIRHRHLYKLVEEIIVEDYIIPKNLLEKYNDKDYTYYFYKINYGKGNKNPIDYIDFYKNDKIIKLANKSQIIPTKFQEIYLRIYIK